MPILEPIIEQKKVEIQKLYNEGLTITNDSYSPILFIPKPLSLITEIKKMSPSHQGLIRQNFDHIKLAEEFINNGASALSVLTDEMFFGGSNDFIGEIKDFCKLPILRKDFIIDKIQIDETINLNADILLLIVAIIKDNFEELLDYALGLGLQVLIETHTEEEMKMALKKIKKLPQDLKSKIFLGINNRNLDTLIIDTNNCLKLKKLIDIEGLYTIAESGVQTTTGLNKLKDAGFDAVLIGEGLAKNKTLLEWFL
jgi:indole-3-glycerol phosphate synthase